MQINNQRRVRKLSMKHIILNRQKTHIAMLHRTRPRGAALPRQHLLQ